mgnify:CR=1 FL=1
MYFFSMEHIKSWCKAANHQFFEPSTMRFFQSKVQTKAPYNGRVFVTSEKCGSWPRRYTVREVWCGTIRTVGDFMAYRTRREAHIAAAEYPAKTK